MKSVLIVDDREPDLYMLQVLLEGHGHSVVLASNGADALKAARKVPPDIIISDIMMPVMDDFRLCQEWMRDERLQTIPFVFYDEEVLRLYDECLVNKLEQKTLALEKEISERKQLAKELDDHRNHLEELVEERTAQLAEARQLADAANLAKSAFPANIATRSVPP